METVERKLQEIGESLLVTLPKPWVKARNLKKGSKVHARATPDGNLTIAPEIATPRGHTSVSLSYDDAFPRRFFREYFKGHEQITIIFNEQNAQHHNNVHSFLSRFMNVQVIDETSNKIIIKCFKIQELSIVECLQRMYHLSASMFDGATEYTQTDQTLAKFYYLLVMQTRRYIDEGKFADENQIPLIKAVDIRMVAEKIERIADEIKQLSENKAIIKAKDYYSKVFDAFLKDDFEKAVVLYVEGSQRTKDCTKRRDAAKTLMEYKIAEGMRVIHQLMLEISMLVR